MRVLIRKFEEKDAEEVSKLIVENLKEVNVRDYSKDIIEKMIPHYKPEALIEKSKKRIILVAQMENRIVGTATLDGNELKAMFVKPDYHRNGIGRTLLREIEDTAKEEGLGKIEGEASLTASGFYKKNGYKLLGEIIREDIRTIRIEKQL